MNKRLYIRDMPNEGVHHLTPEELLSAAIDGNLDAYCYCKPTTYRLVRQYDSIENFDPVNGTTKIVWNQNSTQPGLLRKIDPQLADGYVLIPKHILRAIEGNGECTLSVGRGGQPNIGVETDPIPTIKKGDIFFLENSIISLVNRNAKDNATNQRPNHLEEKYQPPPLRENTETPYPAMAKNILPDSTNSDKHNHDTTLQILANTKAAELIEQYPNAKKPTKFRVASKLHEDGVGNGISAETLERRIRKTW